MMCGFIRVKWMKYVNIFIRKCIIHELRLEIWQCHVMRFFSKPNYTIIKMYKQISRKNHTKTHLDIQSLRHPRNLQHRSIGRFPPHLHTVRFDRRAIVNTRCSPHIQLILHLHRILRDSRSDNRPRGSYKLHLDRKHLDEYTRRCRHIHQMDCPQIPRDIDM